MVARRGTRTILFVPDGRYPGRSLGQLVNPAACWPAGLPRSHKENVVLCWGDELPDLLCEWIDAGYTFVAHNAMRFDAEAWELLVREEFGGPEPAAWCDTLPKCRALGLPGGIDALGKVFAGVGKDEQGKKAMLMLTKGSVKGGDVLYPLGTAPLWTRLLAYNVGDVLLMEKVWDHVYAAGEPDVLAVDTVVNKRGVYFDRPLVNTLRSLWDAGVKDAEARVADLTDGEIDSSNLKSTPQMKAWLAKQGLNVDSLNRQALEQIYADPDSFFDDDADDERVARVVAALKQRQFATRIARSKLDRLLDLADPDDRVRDLLMYWGAHTGRWSGRGFQPHNMARGVGDLDVSGVLAAAREGSLDLDRLRAFAALCNKGAGAQLDDVLSTLMRPVFRAPDGHVLGIVDYAAIECRCLAWLADQENLLAAFRDGQDVYCQMASQVFGRPITKADKAERQIGKVIVLGCGYSMSALKFGAYCKLQRIDLAAAGVTPEQCVEAFRDLYPRVAGVKKAGARFREGGLWNEYAAAAKAAVRDKKYVTAGKCLFRLRDGHLIITLPSGRELTYRNARMEKLVPPYAAVLGITMEPRWTLCYTHHHGYTASLYGGLLTENIDQATSRDIMAAGLVNLEAHEAIPVVLHVHDEAVCEHEESHAGEGLKRQAEVMSTQPAWAGGFPISVEGFTCPHYVKSPFAGAWEVKATNGVAKLEGGPCRTATSAETTPVSAHGRGRTRSGRSRVASAG